MRRDTIAVTGATGMIGRHLLDALLADAGRLRVRALLLPDDAAPAGWERVQVVRGDLRAASAVTALVEGAEAVIHLAASVGDAANRGSMAAARAVNVEGTRLVLEAAARQGTRRFVTLSTCSVYGLTGGRDEMVDESFASAPLDRPYDRSKAEAEALVLDHQGSGGGLEVAALQVPVVLGGSHTPVGRPTALGLMRMVIRGVFPSCVPGPTWANYVWAGDVARALVGLAAAPSDVQGRFIWSEAITFDDFFLSVARALGRRALRMPVPAVAALLAARGFPALGVLANRRRFSAARLRGSVSLGRLAGVHEGLHRTVAHYRRLELLP